MSGLVDGLAFSLEAAHGANFALVLHIPPFGSGSCCLHI